MKTIVIYLVLLVVALTAVSQAEAKAGPVRMSTTLLSLYKKSDSIVIARFDKRQDSGINRIGNGFTIVTTKSYFDVSSVLKGEPQKFLVLENDEYRYQIQNGSDAPRDAVFVEDFESHSSEAEPLPGDTVLIFLKREADQFTLADDRDGVKKLSSADMAVFVDRINELNSMFSNAKPDATAVSAWLVRCAEQPATRWDGAYELLQSVRRSDWRRQNGGRDESKSLDYAGSLTEYDKIALANILILRDLGGEKRSAVRGDHELIELVTCWWPDLSNTANLNIKKGG